LRFLLVLIVENLDCGQFSDSSVSQGCVATYLRYVGIFNNDFVANLLLNPSMKVFWNRSTFSEVTGN